MMAQPLLPQPPHQQQFLRQPLIHQPLVQQPLVEQVLGPNEESSAGYRSAPLPDYVASEDYHDGLKVSLIASFTEGVIDIQSSGNTCRLRSRLRLWHRHFTDQVLHTPEDWTEKDHTRNAAMRAFKGLQSQSSAAKELCNTNDRLPMASQNGSPPRWWVESNLSMSRA
jgi:hypothetical protein